MHENDRSISNVAGQDSRAATSLKIVHVQTRFARAGAEENTWASCLHQQRSGHSVHLLYGPGSDPEHYRKQNDEIGMELVPSLVREIHAVKDLQAYIQLRKAFRRLKPDVVHTHTSKAGIVGRLAAKHEGVPRVIQGVHMLPFAGASLLQRSVYLAAEHIVAPKTDLYIHVSEGVKAAYEKARIGQKIPHMVVKSGMDLAQFRSASWPDDWRNLLGVDASTEKPPVLLMLASLEPRKRHLDFLEGFAAAVRKARPVKLVLAGEGPLRNLIQARATTLGIADHVVMLGYYPSPERLIALSDVGVLASLQEGLPRVVVQYLAGGKPVVVSPIEGIHEIVSDRKNGLISSSQDAESVAQIGVELLSDAKSFESLSAAARASSLDNWSFPAMFNSLDQAYQKVL